MINVKEQIYEQIHEQVHVKTRPMIYNKFYSYIQRESREQVRFQVLSNIYCKLG